MQKKKAGFHLYNCLLSSTQTYRLDIMWLVASKVHGRIYRETRLQGREGTWPEMEFLNPILNIFTLIVLKFTTCHFLSKPKLKWIHSDCFDAEIHSKMWCMHSHITCTHLCSIGCANQITVKTQSCVCMRVQVSACFVDVTYSIKDMYRYFGNTYFKTKLDTSFVGVFFFGITQHSSVSSYH